MSNIVKSILDEINSKRGCPDGWPKLLKYDFNGDAVILETDINNLTLNKSKFRQIDSWGMAFYFNITKVCKTARILFRLTVNEYSKSDLEAFKRRISFLQINNNLNISLEINNIREPLYNEKDLFNRPADEIIRDVYAERTDSDKPGRLEKDFQAYLFGKGKDNPVRTNERLALLGEDFYKLENKGITREFPTGVFKDKVKNNTRILPTEFVDIVTVNKRNELAVIELKLNDPKLEVISQIMDYALFFACYKKLLKPIIEEKLSLENGKKANIDISSRKPIRCYVVNNHYHGNFDDVFKYYTPKKSDYELSLNKITLGYKE